MADLSQIQRQIRILQILSSGRRITTGELLQRFEGSVSRRTLQRDLLSLSEAGIPLSSEKTKANENTWSVMSHFRSFIPIPLEMNEYLAAHILKANLNVFHKTEIESEVQSLIKKIDQLVPEDIFLDMKQAGIEDFFENYSAGLFDYGPFNRIINDLTSAILNRTKCRVTYYNPGQDTNKKFHIEPEKLVYYSGGLYVIVYVRRYKDFILLAIQRIKKLTLLDEKHPKDHPFDPEKFWKGKFGLFSGEPVNVKLRFSKDIIHHIDGRTWHSSQEKEYDKRGNLILTMNVAMTPELISWILGWRKYVKVLKPTELVDQIKRNVDDIKKLY